MGPPSNESMYKSKLFGTTQKVDLLEPGAVLEEVMAFITKI
jgi:hypothetical protein